MNREQDALAAKCEEHALEVQKVPGLAKGARILRVCVSESTKASKTKLSKVIAKSRIVDMEVVTEKARSNRTEHIAWNTRLECDLNELKCKLELTNCNCIHGYWCVDR